MPTINTQDLTDAALDWAVGKAWGLDVTVGTFGPLFGRGHKWACYRSHKYKPSVDWKLAGIIFDAVITEFHAEPDGTYWAATATYGARGATKMEAICRAYVGHRLGLTVDVPQELLA